MKKTEIIFDRYSSVSPFMKRNIAIALFMNQTQIGINLEGSLCI